MKLWKEGIKLNVVENAIVGLGVGGMYEGVGEGFVEGIGVGRAEGGGEVALASNDEQSHNISDERSKMDINVVNKW